MLDIPNIVSDDQRSLLAQGITVSVLTSKRIIIVAQIITEHLGDFTHTGHEVTVPSAPYGDPRDSIRKSTLHRFVSTQSRDQYCFPHATHASYRCYCDTRSVPFGEHQFA